MPYYVIRYEYSARSGHETVLAESPDAAKEKFWQQTGYSKDIVRITDVET